MEGDARETIPSLGGPFDLLFVDGTKVEYRDYIEPAEPKLSERALLVVDNLLGVRRGGPAGGRRHFRRPRTCRGANPEPWLVGSESIACVLPVGDGIGLGARR